MPLNPNASELIMRKGNRKIFIETGTAEGDGIECALKAGFEEIYSIELNPNLFEKCKKKFKDEKNVHLICGSSEKELPKLLENINDPFVLWLDAHYSGGDYITEVMFVYLPKEIDSIKKYSEKFNDSVIMIDDMNYFMKDKNFCTKIEKLINEVKTTGSIQYIDSYSATHLVKM